MLPTLIWALSLKGLRASTYSSFAAFWWTSLIVVGLALVGCGQGEPTPGSPTPGSPTPEASPTPIDQDRDGSPASVDCDDNDPTVYPGSVESCDQKDNNCNGGVDEDPVDAPPWFLDADSDGYGTWYVAQAACQQPEGFVSDASDCDDSNPATYPGATEICDAHLSAYADNDCDGEVDEGLIQVYYQDQDQDGYGDPDTRELTCAPVDSMVLQAGDCDDSNPALHPGALEVCDQLDNNCNVLVDEGLSTTTWYVDLDGDGYGDSSAPIIDCAQPDDTCALDTDCDDTDETISPEGVEICDGQDQDCDGVSDDLTTWYEDLDGDGYGGALRSGCTPPDNAVPVGGDCDDTNATSSPAGTEVCDKADNDCDTVVDEEAIDAPLWYVDTDHDGYGSSSQTKPSCSQPSGYVANADDCNDADRSLNPATVWYADIDADGYGDPASSLQQCITPSGHVRRPGDCNDGDPAMHLYALEVCNDGIDQDCDNVVDDLCNGELAATLSIINELLMGSGYVP